MPIKSLHLVTCPFCPDEIGEIALDVAALEARRCDPKTSDHLRIKRDPGQTIFVFNSPSAKPGPCEHLFIMHGRFGLRATLKKDRARCKWRLDFDWSHEELVRKQKDDEIEEYLTSLRDLLHPGPRPRQPNTQWCEEYWGRVWKMPGLKDSQRHWGYVHAIFVANAASFCNEILRLIPGFQRQLAHRSGKCSDYGSLVEFEEVECEPGTWSF